MLHWFGKSQTFREKYLHCLDHGEKPDSVEYHVQAIEEKINTFDYAEIDLIALNADKDEHILYNIQLAEK